MPGGQLPDRDRPAAVLVPFREQVQGVLRRADAAGGKPFGEAGAHPFHVLDGLRRPVTGFLAGRFRRPVILLEAAHGQLVRDQVGDGVRDGPRGGQGREIRDVVDQRRPPDVVGVRLRLRPQRRVDDQGDLPVLDPVRHVGAPLLDLEHRLASARRFAARNAAVPPVAADGEPHLVEHPTAGRTPSLSSSRTLTNTRPDLRQVHPGRDLRLGEGDPERPVDPHHLAGGLHLRPQQGVHVGELDEGEDRLLHADVRRDDLLREAQLGQLPPRHHLRGELGQRHADGLADERDGARRARVDLEDVDLAALDGELHVHQPDDGQLERHRLRLPGDLGERSRRGSTGAEGSRRNRPSGPRPPRCAP